MRLIDADECEKYFYNHMTDNAMAAAMNAIDEMPTIEPCMAVVSKEAVIKLLKDLEQEDIKLYGCKIPEGFDAQEAIAAVRKLPSLSLKQMTESEV